MKKILKKKMNKILKKKMKKVLKKVLKKKMKKKMKKILKKNKMYKNLIWICEQNNHSIYIWKSEKNYKLINIVS